MGIYITRRLLQAVPLLWLVSLAVFMLLHVIPGGPMAAYENNPDLTAQDLKRLEHDLGLDAPLHVQYLRWLGALLRGDWGYSLASKRPVLVEIGDRLPNTVYLIGVATLVTLLLAIPIGIFSALRQYSTLDHVVTTVAFMGHSIPIFWFGLILIIVFHVTLFPGRGWGRLFIESGFGVGYARLIALIRVRAALPVGFTLLADVSYAALDPRIGYG